jgi:hypothetical protein
MDPLTLLSLLGTGGSLIGSLFGQQQQPEQINPYTADFMTQLQSLMSQYQGGADKAQVGVDQAQSQQQRIASQMGGVTQDIGGLKGPAPNAFMDQFISNIPGYREIAQKTAEDAMRIGGRSIQEQGDLASQRGAQNAARATPAGAGFSGAQAQAVGQGAGNPLADALNQIAQMSAGSYNNTFNQLAGQGQGLAFQGQQAGFQNALGTLQAQLQGLGMEGSLQSQLAGQGINQVGQQLQGFQGALGQYGQNAGPVYSTPSTYNPMAPLSQALGTAGQMFSGMAAQKQNNQQTNFLEQLLAMAGGGGGSIPNQSVLNPYGGYGSYAGRTGQ